MSTTDGDSRVTLADLIDQREATRAEFELIKARFQEADRAVIQVINTTAGAVAHNGRRWFVGSWGCLNNLSLEMTPNRPLPSARDVEVPGGEKGEAL